MFLWNIWGSISTLFRICYELSCQVVWWPGRSPMLWIIETPWYPGETKRKRGRRWKTHSNGIVFFGERHICVGVVVDRCGPMRWWHNCWAWTKNKNEHDANLMIEISSSNKVEMLDRIFIETVWFPFSISNAQKKCWKVFQSKPRFVQSSYELSKWALSIVFGHCSYPEYLPVDSF